MITKMKKLLLFMADSSASVDADLTILGELGVMHMVPFQSARDKSIELVDGQVKDLTKAIALLENNEGETPLADDTDYSTLEKGELTLMEKVLKAEEHRLQLEKQKADLLRDLRWFQDWGNVSPAAVKEVAGRGISIRLYLVADKDLKTIQKRSDVQLLGKLEGQNQLALITEDGNTKLPFDEVLIPENEKEQVENLLKEVNQELAENKQLLARFCPQRKVLEDALEERMHHLNILYVQYGGIAIDGQVHCWKGFIPEDAIDTFVESADKNHWGYVITEPEGEDLEEVPTLVRTSRWAERIRPVMNFMGLVPGYKELDVSQVFMIFFTFFTGILVGDAGYGLIFLVITFLVHRKMKFVKKVEFQLMYTLSASILFWGILTGTYFGSESIASLSLLSKLKVEKLASFGGDNVFVQKFMFLVGAIHLTVGHLQLAWKYNNSVRAIAQLGWVAIVWGLYLVVNQMVLRIPAPGIMIWLFVGGALLVGLFSNPGTSFFKGVLSSLGNLPLSIINGFSDIISYVRLYAVGLSTVLMASSFNQMAIGDGISTVFAGIFAVIILILGHGLNMILAAMAVLVHGVRLNMLEYASHANVEFSGSEYNPFKIKNIKS